MLLQTRQRRCSDTTHDFPCKFEISLWIIVESPENLENEKIFGQNRSEISRNVHLRRGLWNIHPQTYAKRWRQQNNIEIASIKHRKPHFEPLLSKKKYFFQFAAACIRNNEKKLN